MAKVYRTDIGSLRPVERRPDGTIVCDAYLTRAGVFPYRQPDGSTQLELRLPDDVFDGNSLKSFEGRPVTNNHPPGMLDAQNATHFAVGCLLGVPTRDGDHMRGRLSVYDAKTISDMESGKVQVSNGYTCDCLEEPGEHPDFGPYHAIQKNIVGNHIAVVDSARAGLTAAARMDAECMSGMQIALDEKAPVCKNYAKMKVKSDKKEKDRQAPGANVIVDPNDEANRNAEGDNDAPAAKKRQPGQSYEADKDNVDDDDEDCDPDDLDDEDCDPDDDGDAYDQSYVDGELTASARDKIKASNFAVPEDDKLPIHDKGHLKAAMSRFGQTDFTSADQKHGAFNRIVKKAKDLNVSSTGFQKAHAGKLDRLDIKKEPTTMDLKILQEKADKADKRKEKLVAAKARIDELEKLLSEAQAALDNVKRDQRSDADGKYTQAEVESMINAKLDLLDQARATGADVNAKMTELDVKRTVIAHVDGEDAPSDKPPAYIDALYDGALKRSRNDAADTAKGAKALSKLQLTVNTPVPHADAALDTDENAAAARLRSSTRDAWATKEIK